jgi:HEAT repeat protein
VLADPALFPGLFACLSSSNLVVRGRAADAIAKVAAQRPSHLQPYKAKILRLAAITDQNIVRWHLALLFNRFKLTAREREIALDILLSYLEDRSSIVRTFAMQGLADLALSDPSLLDRIVPVIQHCTATGSPAMKARGRMLLKQLRKTNPLVHR